jgi:hypothetical protein
MKGVSRTQMLIAWATLCLASASVIYPKPAYWKWERDRWKRLVREELYNELHDKVVRRVPWPDSAMDERRFVLDMHQWWNIKVLEYGSVLRSDFKQTPDVQRTVAESFFVLIAGGALIGVLRKE